MNKLPLVFSFAQLVQGDGFLAGVKMDGRALLEEEDGESWLMGASPAGFAGSGTDRSSAFADFRNRWVAVLFDIATEASTFEAFKSSCEAFLGCEQDHLTEEWEEALAEVRRTNYRDPSLRAEVASEHAPYFEVVELDAQKFSPEHNRLECPPALATAA